MKPLYTLEQFNSAKSTDKLPCECYFCKNIFHKEKRDIKKHLNGHEKIRVKFCSNKCKFNSNITQKRVNCLNCNKEFNKLKNQIQKTKNNFCSRSCAAIYNNTHKKTGTRRSKLESYLEQQLISIYPNVEFHFNKKDAINSELDIYIPSLKLAFELNGIYHYEPIHGSNKLNQTQNNDQRKFQACIEQGISLCIIDISKQKYFKESTSKEFLNIIIGIINNKSKN